VNLFSITKALTQDWQLGNEGTTMFLKQGNITITFDKKMPTHKGLVVGCEIFSRHIPHSGKEMVLTTMSGKAQDGGDCNQNAGNCTQLIKGNKMDTNQFHAILGHPSFDSTKRTATYYGITLTGVAKPCDDCALAKSRQKNLKKESFFRSTEPGERLYIDQSYIRQKSYGGRECWLLIVDDCTDHCWSHFLKSRDEQNSFLISIIKDLKAKAQVIVRYIRCDNAGENIALEKLCLLEGMGIQFEYTSPHTPQLNGRVERKFGATLYQRCRSMLNGARLNPNLRNGL
jgi:hypothetical protein